MPCCWDKRITSLKPLGVANLSHASWMHASCHEERSLFELRVPLHLQSANDSQERTAVMQGRRANLIKPATATPGVILDSALMEINAPSERHDSS